MWSTLFPPFKPDIDDTQYMVPHIRERLLTKGHWVPEYAEGTFLVFASDWMIAHLEVPTIAMLVYVFLIFFLKRTMANRPAFELKLPLTIWNLILAGLDFLLYFD